MFYISIKNFTTLNCDYNKLVIILIQPGNQKNKRAKNSSTKEGDKTLGVLNRVADAIATPRPAISIPPSQSADDVDTLLAGAAIYLRRLPECRGKCS